MANAPCVPHLNKKYMSEDVMQKLIEAFKNKAAYSDDGLDYFSQPFSVCHLTNFLEEEDYLDHLRKELLDIKLDEKNNDLYKFHQSKDLKHSKSSYISVLRKFLYETFRNWVQDVTGIELNTTMDLNFARYDYTDTLLCHDDMLEGRRIAYILYLVPEWEHSDGGLLDLFDTDERGEPREVVKSLVPQWNSFAFFEVNEKSFHQVSEVVSRSRSRLSISGWFYGTPVVYPTVLSTSTLNLLPGKISDLLIADWINPSYLDVDAQVEIRKKFEQDSEVELLEFLQNAKYEELLAACQNNTIEWEKRGPPNKRNYEVGLYSSLSPILKEFFELFQSDMMSLFLSNITGLKLHKSAVTSSSDDESDEDSDDENDRKRPKLEEDSSEKTPKCCCDLRRWKHGSYTLLHDGDDELSGFALDAFLFLDCQDWSNEYGGYISYIAKDEDEELLTANPQENALALVFRDEETLRFVKHVNHKSQALGKKSRFFSIVGVFTE